MANFNLWGRAGGPHVRGLRQRRRTVDSAVPGLLRGSKDRRGLVRGTARHAQSPGVGGNTSICHTGAARAQHEGRLAPKIYRDLA